METNPKVVAVLEKHQPTQSLWPNQFCRGCEAVPFVPWTPEHVAEMLAPFLLDEDDAFTLADQFRDGRGDVDDQFADKLEAMWR